MISSGVLGGGLGSREWVLNAQVPARYSRTDPAAHLAEIAAGLGLDGPGVGLLTAAQVTDLVEAEDGGVRAAATVGLRVPTWAAAAPGTPDPELAPTDLEPAQLAPVEPALVEPAPVEPAPVEPAPVEPAPVEPAWRPGTINIIVAVPVPLSDAAFVNAVITATEAKSQAVLQAGYSGTGTASDAICVAAPDPAGRGAPPEDFAGPRSPWGARIARAVHVAVLAGATHYLRKLGQPA
jgi:adenosylcobinamide amidohydrolase